MATMIALLGSFFALWTFLAWIAGALFCSTVATAKNLNSFMWFLGGLMFPLVALIAVAGMPSKLSKHEKRLLLEKYEAHETAKKVAATLERAESISEMPKPMPELIVRDDNGGIITPEVKNGVPAWVIVGTLVLLVVVLWVQSR